MNISERVMAYCFRTGTPVIEIRDAEAKIWVEEFHPRCLAVMPETLAKTPHYDDRELMMMAELFTLKLYAVIAYIEGNAAADLNGWIVRIFPGVTSGSAQHEALHNLIYGSATVMDWIRE